MPSDVFQPAGCRSQAGASGRTSYSPFLVRPFFDLARSLHSPLRAETGGLQCKNRSKKRDFRDFGARFPACDEKSTLRVA
jgi:hypothetical protein